VTVAKLTNTR